MRTDLQGQWSRDLLESDRLYFEADAETIPIAGATIALLHGAESLAAGCVVHRIDAAALPARADAWLSALEARLRALGSPRARIYLDQPAPGLEAALAQRGYRSRVEIGFVCEGASGESEPIVELAPADGERGWSARREIMERCRLGPDGHQVDADLWVEMERRKCRAGYMQPYLIVAKGDVVGAASLATCGSLLRLKNLFIDPDFRRRGVATATAIGFARFAARMVGLPAGCFAVEGEPGVVVYALAGYREVTRQTEWVRDLEGATA